MHVTDLLLSSSFLLFIGYGDIFAMVPAIQVQYSYDPFTPFLSLICCIGNPRVLWQYILAWQMFSLEITSWVKFTCVEICCRKLSQIRKTFTKNRADFALWISECDE